MTRPPVRDVAASVRDRLRNHATATRQDFQRVLVRYGVERLLYRLARSLIRDRFVLKGAMLFATWTDAPFRATGDVDFLAFGDPGVEAAKSAFISLCEAAVDVDDGLIFQADTVVVERTREDEAYQGVRVRFDAKLKNIVIPILIDIGFGDVIHPAALDIDYPRLLDDLPAAHIRAYPAATVIAEKFDAMVRFGDQASRLKDHYDIWAISRTFEFDLATLIAAVRATLENRPAGYSRRLAGRPRGCVCRRSRHSSAMDRVSEPDGADAATAAVSGADHGATGLPEAGSRQFPACNASCPLLVARTRAGRTGPSDDARWRGSFDDITVDRAVRHEPDPAGTTKSPPRKARQAPHCETAAFPNLIPAPRARHKRWLTPNFMRSS